MKSTRMIIQNVRTFLWFVNALQFNLPMCTRTRRKKAQITGDTTDELSWIEINLGQSCFVWQIDFILSSVVFTRLFKRTKFAHFFCRASYLDENPVECNIRGIYIYHYDTANKLTATTNRSKSSEKNATYYIQRWLSYYSLLTLYTNQNVTCCTIFTLWWCSRNWARFQSTRSRRHAVFIRFYHSIWMHNLRNAHAHAVSIEYDASVLSSRQLKKLQIHAVAFKTICVI